jgi:LemA protein
VSPTPPELAALFAVGVVTFLVLFLAVATYNAIVALRERIDRAWANIDVVLRQRHDQLPNLVGAVRDVLAFEQDVLERVTQLRGAYRPDEPIGRQAATSEATTGAVRQLLAVVERYPTLRSQANVLELQHEIERLEGVIADRRELYNDTVYRYNTRIGQVPAVLLAWLFDWRPRAFFRGAPEDAIPPSTELRAA